MILLNNRKTVQPHVQYGYRVSALLTIEVGYENIYALKMQFNDKTSQMATLEGSYVFETHLVWNLQNVII